MTPLVVVLEGHLLRVVLPYQPRKLLRSHLLKVHVQLLQMLREYTCDLMMMMTRTDNHDDRRHTLSIASMQ